MKIQYITLLICASILFTMCGQKELKKSEEKPLEKVKDTITEVKVIQKEVKTVQKEPLITFTVQIGAFKKYGQSLGKVPEVIQYNKDEYSKYSLGSFQTVREAVNLMYSIEEDYPDAFVQALKDGKPIHISEAL